VTADGALDWLFEYSTACQSFGCCGASSLRQNQNATRSSEVRGVCCCMNVSRR